MRSAGQFAFVLLRSATGTEFALENVSARAPTTEEEKMLWTICVILVVLWLLGMVSSYTMGGFIHVLLVVAIIVVLLNVIQGRRL